MSRDRIAGLIPLLLVALALTAFVLHRVGLFSPAQGLLGRITTPLQEGVHAAASWLGDLTQTARDLRDLRQRNEELESENARLLLENVRLREVQAEATLLRDLLNLAQSNPSLDVQAAHVIGRDPTNVARYVTLDAGTEAGIERNMPVMTDRGLVGRISEVGRGWSRVLLITAASSSVNALTQGTRASGLIEGQVDGSLAMRSILQGETVSVGDTVFTSGLGGNFPRQILIGQITAVQRNDYDLYQSATVEPTVDFQHLEAVLIVTGFESVEDEQAK